jgi:hypothetical protein
MVLESGDGRREAPEQKQNQREQPEQRQRHHGAVGRHTGVGFGQPAPQKKHGERFEDEEDCGENGNKKTFELLARALSRKNLRVLGFKQSRAALRAGHLLQLQLFHPLLFFEPHLKPAHESDEDAHADVGRSDLPCERIGVARHDKSGRAHAQKHEQVHQAVPLNVAIHWIRSMH